MKNWEHIWTLPYPMISCDVFVRSVKVFGVEPSIQAFLLIFAKKLSFLRWSCPSLWTSPIIGNYEEKVILYVPVQMATIFSVHWELQIYIEKDTWCHLFESKSYNTRISNFFALKTLCKAKSKHLIKQESNMNYWFLISC